jgi:hypothetical protein
MLLSIVPADSMSYMIETPVEVALTFTDASVGFALYTRIIPGER